MAREVLGFGLEKTIGSTTALRGVDLALRPGVYSLLGPNGSGKTTLLRCLATVLAPDRGTLLIDGLDASHESDRVEIRRRLGYLPQHPGLAPSATLFDVLDYIAVLKQIPHERARRRCVYEQLDRVGLADRAADRVESLSGGMKQRAGLAQAMLGAPTLLLLDEPAAGLDPDERFRLRELVAERRSEAIVVQSTHLTDEAIWSDQLLVLIDGALSFVGTPAALAGTAAGRAWVQSEPPVTARAHWRQADGSYRCLGTPPPGAAFVDPTVEDGYLLLGGKTS